jgi:hypothetical protein
VATVGAMSDELNSFDFADRVPNDVVVSLEVARHAALQYLHQRDYAAARIKANFCLLIIATIPDGDLGGVASQSWDRKGIIEFLAQLDRLEAAQLTEETGGMLLQSFQYTGRRSC